MKRSFIRGPITPFRGQQRSPWLLTTYPSPGMILQVWAGRGLFVEQGQG